MPKAPIPQKFHDLLESTALAHLATIDDRSRPQVNPVWFMWDGEHVMIGVLGGTKKLDNVRRDPHIALSILDKDDPGRYLEVRGEVVNIEPYFDLSFVNELSRKYTGGDAEWAVAGDARYKLTIRPDSWTAMG